MGIGQAHYPKLMLDEQGMQLFFAVQSADWILLCQHKHAGTVGEE